MRPFSHHEVTQQYASATNFQTQLQTQLQIHCKFVASKLFHHTTAYIAEE